ncbi:MAG: transglutaminase domain-containing protein [Lachnospiraceae bacterium]
MKKTFFMAIVICFAFLNWSKTIPVQAQIHYAEEDETIVIVSNREEFFEAVCYQIREHKSVVTYDTYVNALGIDLQEAFNYFYYHHNANDLLNSGSYFGRYIKDGEVISQHGDFSGDHNFRIEVHLQYVYDKQEMDDYFQNMKELAAQLRGESDYESVKAVHDYLIRNYDYDDTCENYLDYEGYLNGTMVCQGYCMAAFLLLAEMDIPVRIVTGASQDYQADANHAWNVVKVDGKWYNMDVTWDDKGGNTRPDYTFFLKSDADFYKHTREGIYDYDKDMAIVSYSTPEKPDIKIGLIVAANYSFCGDCVQKIQKGRRGRKHIGMREKIFHSLMEISFLFLKLFCVWKHLMYRTIKILG